jgi:hypothetical protein
MAIDNVLFIRPDSEFDQDFDNRDILADRVPSDLVFLSPQNLPRPIVPGG